MYYHDSTSAPSCPMHIQDRMCPIFLFLVPFSIIFLLPLHWHVAKDAMKEAGIARSKTHTFTLRGRGREGKKRE